MHPHSNTTASIGSSPTLAGNSLIEDALQRTVDLNARLCETEAHLRALGDRLLGEAPAKLESRDPLGPENAAGRLPQLARLEQEQASSYVFAKRLQEQVERLAQTL